MAFTSLENLKNQLNDFFINIFDIETIKNFINGTFTILPFHKSMVLLYYNCGLT